MDETRESEHPIYRFAGMGIQNNMSLSQKRSIILNNMLSQNDGFIHGILSMLSYFVFGSSLMAIGFLTICLGKLSVLLIAKAQKHLLAKIVSVYIFSLVIAPIVIAAVNTNSDEEYLASLYFIAQIGFCALSFDWTQPIERTLSIIACISCLIWLLLFPEIDAWLTLPEGAIQLGDTVWARMAPMATGVMVFLCYIVMRRIDLDSTNRLTKSIAVAQTQASFQETILATVETMIMSMDIDGTITSFNKKAESLLGYQASELIGKQNPSIFHDKKEMEERAKEISKAVGRNVSIGIDLLLAKSKAGLPNAGEWTFIRKDGSRFPVKLINASIKNDKGELVGFTKVAADITVRKEAEKTILQQHEELTASEEELKQNLEELHRTQQHVLSEKQKLEETLHKLKETQNQLIQAEKMSSLGQLTAGVAHEINNPVNFISTGTQTLKHIITDLFELLECYAQIEEFDDDNIKKELRVEIEEKILEAGNRMELQEDANLLFKDIEIGINRVVDIVRGLRNFSRTDNVEQLMADIHEMLDSSLLILSSKHKGRLSVIKKYDESLPQILCFAGQLSQVFLNIIGNAIDATPDKGTIEITTLNKEDFVEIQIADSGIGMPEEVVKDIFNPFFTTKPVGKGTGLGLSISHGIIEKHKGTIRVVSAENKGSTFIIEIPKQIDMA